MYLGTEASRVLWNHLCSMGYIDNKGHVQDALKTALKQNAVDLPEQFQAQAEQVQAVLRKVAGNLNIQNADNRKAVKLNKDVYLSEDFKQLWDRIKYLTTFRVDFDSEKLIETCATEIRDNLKVGKARFVTRIARIAIDRGGVAAQELFEQNELFGYLSKNMIASAKSVYDHIVYDSEVEEAFARSFEQSEEVKVFAKLPGWFKIDTPLGSYNPDWAVLVDMSGRPRLFFVVESKGSLFSDALRPIEQGKIDCGKAHFKALGTDVQFAVANNYATFSSELTG